MSDLEIENPVIGAIKTLYPPCCLQILSDSKHILVGTYELKKETGLRIGSIDVYEYDSESSDKSSKVKLVCRYTDDISAILDLKLNGNGYFMTAHSTGDLRYWKYTIEGDDFQIEMINKYQVFSEDVLITSCHVKSSSGVDGQGETVLCTGTNGELKLISLSTSSSNDSDVAQGVYEFNGSHSLECWTGEFGKIAPLENCLFSGGDDSVIKLFDTRTKDEVWSNSRIHEAGVVAIKCASETFRCNRPTSILTGSYDDHIRSFDLRMLTETDVYPGVMPPLNLQSKNLQGGVWRFFESPHASKGNQSSDEVMVCCMYNGAKIVKIWDAPQENDADGNQFFEETHFVKTGHDSMCYGGDWNTEFIATCSFYDNSLQLWSPL